MLAAMWRLHMDKTGVWYISKLQNVTNRKHTNTWLMNIHVSNLAHESVTNIQHSLQFSMIIGFLSHMIQKRITWTKYTKCTLCNLQFSIYICLSLTFFSNFTGIGGGELWHSVTTCEINQYCRLHHLALLVNLFTDGNL